LKDNRKVALATHNIIAYRFIDSTKNCLIEDYDDDGETSAGGRLLHLLQVMNALNVLVVVTRWYTY
jgi:putative IMPACT (imprinted ancient) family translation regulator